MSITFNDFVELKHASRLFAASRFESTRRIMTVRLAGQRINGPPDRDEEWRCGFCQCSFGRANSEFKGTNVEYKELAFKIPQESADYRECSDHVLKQIDAILHKTISAGKNKIIINTNLRLGLPMENINKVAGPFVEAWAFEIFQDITEDKNNEYELVNVEAQERLHMADIILQFKKRRRIESKVLESSITAEVDVKATAVDFENSGKSPNITSFGRIRTAYVEEPDYIFVILSLKHRVYSKRNEETNLMDGVMEVVGYKSYDLKYLSSADISYNPALGTGQIQVRDIHYISLQCRTTWEFCQLLDQKYLHSSKRSFRDWLSLAQKNGWIKVND